MAAETVLKPLLSTASQGWLVGFRIVEAVAAGMICRVGMTSRVRTGRWNALRKENTRLMEMARSES